MSIESEHCKLTISRQLCSKAETLDFSSNHLYFLCNRTEHNTSLKISRCFMGLQCDTVPITSEPKVDLINFTLDCKCKGVIAVQLIKINHFIN